MMSDHEGEELPFVLTGDIEMHIGARKQRLRPGDGGNRFDDSAEAGRLDHKPASWLVVIAATA